jgi:hypothetical protein
MTFSRSTRTLAALIASTFLSLASSPGAAVAAVPAGVTINAVLASPDINTKNAAAGNPFVLNVVAPYPSSSFQGAIIHGHVADASRAGQGKKPHLKLAFDSITYANGESESIRGTVTHIQTVAENTTARKGLGAGVGAAVGSQTIGRIIGGAAGAVIGIAGGAAAGYAYGANDKANFSVVKGAALTLQTTPYQPM